MPVNGISDYMPTGQIPPRLVPDLKKEAAKNAATDAAVGQFLDDIEKGSIPEVKLFLGSIGRAEELRGLITLYRLTGGSGTPRATRIKLLKLIFMTRGRGAAKLMEELAAPSSKFFITFSKFAAKANGAALMVTAAEVSYHLSRGDVGPAFAEAFKFGASKLWPWMSIIEAVQSLIDGFIPDRQTSSLFMGVLRMLDPVGVGAVGVDAVATCAQMIYEEARGRGLNEQVLYGRLNSLNDRMQGGATGYIAALSYKVGSMSRQELKDTIRNAIGDTGRTMSMQPRGMMR